MPVAHADAAAVALLGGRLDKASKDPRRMDPRLLWRRTARPDQLMPPIDGTWRVMYMQGGRGSGKTRTGAQSLAEIILNDTGEPGQYGICAPTYRDAWTVCVEGEALALDTYVPTPAGHALMGDLRAGDEVIGGDGTPCRVTAAYDVLTGRDCYRVTFKGGVSVIADGAHKWLVEDHADRTRNRLRGGSFPPYVVTTEQMAPNVRVQNCRGSWRNYGVRVAKAGYGEAARALPIDPYVLGAWLGDGTAKSGEITTADPEVLDHVRAAGYAVSARSDNGSHGRARAYGILGLRKPLREAGLLRNKHVPDAYMRAGAQDRLSVLQGLMDTDGYVSRRGQCEFVNKNRLLADAVCELACSLGVKASRPRSKVTRLGTVHWIVKFTTTEQVFRLARKAERIPARYRDAGHWLVESVDPVPSVPVRCISVDSPDRTYLVTRHHIATHNSGLLAALGTTAGEVKHNTSKMVDYAYRSYGEIGLRSGHTVYVDSADDGALRVQGKNLRALWGDEIGLWERWDTAWNESIRYAVRQGASVIIATGTPKASRPARALVRSLIRNEPEHGGVIVRRLRTVDNAKNLSSAFYRAVVGASKGTRLERQELEGELLDDVPNALWTRELLERIQVPPVGGEGGIPFLHRAVIGVDPSDGAESSDEQAYTVTGLGGEMLDTLYVAKNWGGQEAPATFARRVVLEAVRWQARIVVEKNHGGEWLRSTFAQVVKDLSKSGAVPPGKSPAVQTVWASQAKRTRAEPVSALYERGLVRHCKMVEQDREGRPYAVSMVDLEDQMATFVGAQGERSPDRLDSLVWAVTPFLNDSFGGVQQAVPRRWAFSEELDELVPPDRPDGLGPGARRRLEGAHGGQLSAAVSGWDISDFAPRDGDDAGGHPREREDRAVPTPWR